MDKTQLASMLDHTILKAAATKDDVATICQEALDIGAASVCINPANVAQAATLLAGSAVKVCTVIGFPLGANTAATKAFETTDAIKNGAQEIDMVINVGALVAGETQVVFDDIKAVVKAAKGTTVKVIIETCYLTKAQKITACELAMEAGADFVKTSTGFGTGGATAEDVALMRSVVGRTLSVKASGGIRDYATAMAMVDAGANRLGVSASMSIVDGAE